MLIVKIYTILCTGENMNNPVCKNMLIEFFCNAPLGLKMPPSPLRQKVWRSLLAFIYLEYKSKTVAGWLNVVKLYMLANTRISH